MVGYGKGKGKGVNRAAVAVIKLYLALRCFAHRKGGVVKATVQVGAGGRLCNRQGVGLLVKAKAAVCRAVGRQQNGAAVHKGVVLQAFGAVCGQVNRFSVVAKPGKVGAKVGGSLGQPTAAF